MHALADTIGARPPMLAHADAVGGGGSTGPGPGGAGGMVSPWSADVWLTGDEVEAWLRGNFDLDGMRRLAAATAERRMWPW